MTENLAENIDKDTLVALLKEKGKEMKVLESKNKKLEERYVKIFRENKSLVKDRETLEKLLLHIFDRDQAHFQNKEVGKYDDAGPLIELWNQRQEEKLMLFNETLENCKVEKSELLGKISQLEKQLEQAEKQNNPDLGKLEERYQNANEKLAQEIKEFEKIIEEKDKEIVRLQKAEQEVEGLKAELLFKDLMLKTGGGEKDLKAKMLENDRKNELLRLKHELEEAQEKARQLEEDLAREKGAKKTVETVSEGVQTDGINLQEMMNPSITDLFDNSPIHRENVRRASFGTNDSAGETATHLSDSGLVNQEYLKNVIVKLFCYIEGNNAKEVKTLMHAISVILKMSPEDKEKIEDAKKGGNNHIWSGAVSFIKDHFGGGKGEVNYAATHLSRNNSVA